MTRMPARRPRARSCTGWATRSTPADLITAAQGQGITIVTPVLLDHSAQARAAEGFD